VKVYAKMVTHLKRCQLIIIKSREKNFKETSHY